MRRSGAQLHFSAEIRTHMHTPIYKLTTGTDRHTADPRHSPGIVAPKAKMSTRRKVDDFLGCMAYPHSYV